MKNENNFWQTKRGLAIIKLGAWFIFVVIIIIFFSSSKSPQVLEPTENDTDTTKNYEFATYDSMQEKILSGNYNYHYNLTIDNNIYIYDGIKCNKENTGYKESSDGIIKYLIKNDKTYKVLLKEQIEINDLFQNIDTNYLNLDVLFQNLKEYLYSVEKNEDARIIKYNKEGYQVTVKTNLKEITNIDITVDNMIYNLEFASTDACSND